MPVHNVGGERVVVSTSSRNFFIYRRQGISIEVSPKKNWWCLWLCSSTKKIERIQCSIQLSGVAAPAEASGQCSNCGSLNVMGPAFWGFAVPQPYQQVAYEGTVRIKGQNFPISGSMQY